jgi:Ca2+-binding EF-hand superfamily protein
VTQSLLGKSAKKEQRQRQTDGGRQYADEHREDQHRAFSRRTALKFDEEEELVCALKEQLKLEKELEDAKITLTTCADFNLMDAFQVVDKHSKGWITGPELIEALAEFGSFPHKDDVYLFVRRYDSDSDGRLLYSDFCEAFTPKDTLSQQILTKRPAYHLQNGYSRLNYFTQDTRAILLKTFRTHFSVEETSELLRKRLGRRPNFSVHDAFQTVDRTNTGYLTTNDV